MKYSKKNKKSQANIVEQTLIYFKINNFLKN